MSDTGSALLVRQATLMVAAKPAPPNPQGEALAVRPLRGHRDGRVAALLDRMTN